MYRSVKHVNPHVSCSNHSVKNIVGLIGAQTSQVKFMVLMMMMMLMVMRMMMMLVVMMMMMVMIMMMMTIILIMMMMIIIIYFINILCHLCSD